MSNPIVIEETKYSLIKKLELRRDKSSCGLISQAGLPYKDDTNYVYRKLKFTDELMNSLLEFEWDKTVDKSYQEDVKYVFLKLASNAYPYKPLAHALAEIKKIQNMKEGK